MPVPSHSVPLPSVQLPVVAECDGVTEMRVHGVGGTPPDAILGDLAPEQVSGDAIAGFYHPPTTAPMTGSQPRTGTRTATWRSTRGAA